MEKFGHPSPPIPRVKSPQPKVCSTFKIKPGLSDPASVTLPDSPPALGPVRPLSPPGLPSARSLWKKVRKQVLAEKAEEDSGAETHRLRKEVRRLAARCQQLEQQLRVRQQCWRRDYEGSRVRTRGRSQGPGED
mmetsp:Transcript_32548/g.37128  ORF Transcript_32548/g.37128 Transcript_32548/m.37128 type:complete len:134 (+) Transcript_32548:167-568(+)